MLHGLGFIKVSFSRRQRWLLLLLLACGLILTWQIVFAQEPVPNPNPPLQEGGNPLYAPIPGADITLNGVAVNMHGYPGAGRILFAQNCTPCHNDRGIGGIPNPGSDDGTVPPLNPIDPGFLEVSDGDPDVLVRAIDLFIQHGSRPSGDNPQISMIGWGDHKLRTQPEIADLEAYVMQLNGVYWPDRFYPPAEVRMTAVQSGTTITYTINLINHGGSILGDWTLKDTLPPGLVYIKSGLLGLDRGTDAQVIGSTVQWVGGPNVSQGESLGPFIIVTGMTGNTVPVNVAELRFTFSTFDGQLVWAGAVSDPVLPGAPKNTIKATLPIIPGQPTITSAVAATATLSPQLPTSVPSAPTSAASTGTPVAVAPTSVPAMSTPVVVAPAAANFLVQIVQPLPSALSWVFAPPLTTVHTGDSVIWTNTGSLVHSVTADDGSFDAGLLNPGDSWSNTFTTAGTFTYHCTPHPWMKGTLVVLSAGQ